VDIYGNWVFPPRYKSILSFYRGHAAFRADDGLWGLIDTDGNVALKATYKTLFRNVKGLTGVYVDGKLGFIDDTFRFVVEPRYSAFRWGPVYQGGLVFVTDKDTNEVFALDNDGNTAFTFSNRTMEPNILTDVEGYYVMRIPKMPNWEEALINEKGEIVLNDPDFTVLLPSKEGIVQVMKDKLCGLVILNH
jgi:outer membrane protein assembly factor BamB